MKTCRKILIISIIFLILNIIFINFYNPAFDGDDVGYFEIAQNIMTEGIFSIDGQNPTALRTPGYPLMVAGTLSLFKDIHSVYYLNSLLLLLTAIIGFLVYKEMFGEKYSLVALIAILFYPALFLYTRRVESEIPFTFFIMLTTYLLIKSYRSTIMSRKIILFILAGVSAGYLCLIRPSALYFFIMAPAVVIAISLFRIISRPSDVKGSKRTSGNAWTALMLIALFSLGFIMTYGPWVVRNYDVFGKFIPTENINGIVGYFALHDNSAVSWDKGLTLLSPDATTTLIDITSHNEVERNEKYMKASIEDVKNDPSFAVGKYFTNISRILFLPDLYESLNERINPDNHLQYIILIALAAYIAFFWSLWILLLIFIISLLIDRFMSDDDNGRVTAATTTIIWGLIFFLAYFILIHGMTEGVRRYVDPILPLVIIVAVNTFFRKTLNDKIGLLS